MRTFSATSFYYLSGKDFEKAVTKVLRGEVDYKLLNGMKVNFKDETDE